MTAHPVQWQSPQPLWSRFGGEATSADQARPAILRFATDDFMEQMLGTLARDPARLGQLVARPETWRAPMDGAADLAARVPLPTLAQTGARKTSSLRAKVNLALTAPEARVNEPALSRTVPLKLYQPAHQRFYLASASLVCRLAGFPERAVTAGGAEQVAMVLRRLVPRLPDSTDPESPLEFAYVKDAEGGRWMRLGDHENDANVAQLAAGEESLPAFPLGFGDDSGRVRTLWTGSIPVGRREEYLAATVDRTQVATFAAGQVADVNPPAAPPRAPSKQARLAHFKLEVAEPWKNLVRAAFAASASLQEGPPEGIDGDGESAIARDRRAFAFNLQQQTASWLVLLDFADYLATYLPDVWAAIVAGAPGTLGGRRLELYHWLGAADMTPGLVQALRNPDGNAQLKAPSPSLRAALLAVRTDAVRDGLERGTLLYALSNHSNAQWPAFHFVLAGVDTAKNPRGPFEDLASLAAAPASEVAPDPSPSNPLTPSQQAAEQVDRLIALVGRALDNTVETNVPAPPFAMQVGRAMAANAADPGWFVVRFVYTRRDCGPLHKPAVSDASQRFQLANFFDPDAPARPIRITLPLDTSPAALRKYNRGTAFVISDMLCGQIQRAKSMGLVDLVRSVLPWPLHKPLEAGGGACQSGGTSIGMICSLSIPIITICALILLIIIVTLFDFIFRWLPYFILCFPVPGLKGKKAGA
jgi:hypothetical protein